MWEFVWVLAAGRGVEHRGTEGPPAWVRSRDRIHWSWGVRQWSRQQFRAPRNGLLLGDPGAGGGGVVWGPGQPRPTPPPPGGGKGVRHTKQSPALDQAPSPLVTASLGGGYVTAVPARPWRTSLSAVAIFRVRLST